MHVRFDVVPSAWERLGAERACRGVLIVALLHRVQHALRLHADQVASDELKKGQVQIHYKCRCLGPTGVRAVSLLSCLHAFT